MDKIELLLHEVVGRLVSMHAERLHGLVENHYFVAGKPLTVVVEPSAPSEGHEVCIDGLYYEVRSVVRHLTMCPPWRYNVHMIVAGDQTTAR
jgi:hypothetical protein